MKITFEKVAQGFIMMNLNRGAEVFTLPVFLLFAASLLPQSGSSPVLPAADCKNFGMSPGCASFNEMLAAGDKDIVQLLENPSEVCFRDRADVFMLVSYLAGPKIQLDDGKPEAGLAAHGVVFFARFEKQAKDQYFHVLGLWVEREDQPIYEFADFHTEDKKASESASIRPTEIAVYDSYTNRKNSTTDYTLKIRRSTHRFIETYHIRPAKDSTLPVDSVTFEGRCKHYPL